MGKKHSENRRHYTLLHRLYVRDGKWEMGKLIIIIVVVAVAVDVDTTSADVSQNCNVFSVTEQIDFNVSQKIVIELSILRFFFVLFFRLKLQDVVESLAFFPPSRFYCLKSFLISIMRELSVTASVEVNCRNVIIWFVFMLIAEKFSRELEGDVLSCWRDFCAWRKSNWRKKQLKVKMKIKIINH